MGAMRELAPVAWSLENWFCPSLATSAGELPPPLNWRFGMGIGELALKFVSPGGNCPSPPSAYIMGELTPTPHYAVWRDGPNPHLRGVVPIETQVGQLG